MYILAVDTTAKTAACAVCEVKNEKIFPICSSQLNSTLTHSESILPMIDFCLKNAALSVDDMDFVAVSAGPGSFTGVRIGISTVMGLTFGSYEKRCVSVSALEALAHNVDDYPVETVICACMDARRQQFYNALFMVKAKGVLERLSEDRAIDCNELFSELENMYPNNNVVIVGDGAELAYSLFQKNDMFNENKYILSPYERMYQNGVSVAKCGYLYREKSVSSNMLTPVYLRMSQAERERCSKEGKD